MGMRNWKLAATRQQSPIKPTNAACPHPGGSERRNVAIQTINIEVDERGYIYVADRPNTGVHILELKGDAR